MSKNLCPENNLLFVNSQTIRFETNIPAGTYTASAIVKSTDTDSSVCLMLFYYADNSTKEVYISRSVDEERVSKTFDLTAESTKVRVYASEGYSPSVDDSASFSQLMIEAGSVMTDYVPYGDEPTEEYNLAELCLYFAAMARAIPLAICHDPTCRLTHLLRKYLDPDYLLPTGFSTGAQSIAEVYIWDLILGTKVGLVNTPKSDMEKYLHAMIGGTAEEMPDPDGSVLNYWMNQALEAIKNGN